MANLNGDTGTPNRGTGTHIGTWGPLTGVHYQGHEDPKRAMATPHRNTGIPHRDMGTASKAMATPYRDMATPSRDPNGNMATPNRDVGTPMGTWGPLIKAQEP